MLIYLHPLALAAVIATAAYAIAHELEVLAAAVEGW